MKKAIFEIAYALVSVSLLLAFGNAIAKAQQNQTQVTFPIYIPAIFNNLPAGHMIQGRVLNQQNIPMSGVTIRTDKGQTAITDQIGSYTLSGLQEGIYTLTPSQGGTIFSPTSSSVVIPPDVLKLNFTAQVQCSQAVLNGGFEDNSGWNIPTTEYPAGYTSTQARSGSRSMRTGIIYPADNTFSYSAAQQKVTIPAGTTSAYFTFWIKPYSGVTGGMSLPPRLAKGSTLENATLAGDVQYVLLLDSNYNIIDTLVWQLSNSRTWTQYQFNLVGYAGHSIWLHFGTYNDGLNGVSAMFVDDVSVDICPGGGSPTPSPTPGQCSNLFHNPGFESNTDWEIPNTAHPAGYSEAQAHSGSRSMRTGILRLADNVYSYSDFRQAVHIPSGAALATARFWLYTLSGESKAMAEPEVMQPTGKPFDNTVLSGDLQYVLILDQYQNWIDTLFWQRSDVGAWHYYEFDLRRYAGYTIYLQFGTYNDGYNGITSMFVDDASLDNCLATPTPTRTPTPTPTLTPTPGACQELILNKNFDLNTGWVILNTEYPAAYTNTEYHSPFRAMRSGIVAPVDNLFSYSDFRQAVSVPSNTHHVTLSTWEYFTSSGITGMAQVEQPTPTGKPFTGTVLTDDIQYLLILDHDQNWIGTLIWQRSNTQVWTNMQFDLSAYAGRTIILQWGVFNNGAGGITGMYVDDVSLQACP